MFFKFYLDWLFFINQIIPLTIKTKHASTEIIPKAIRMAVTVLEDPIKIIVVHNCSYVDNNYHSKFHI